jgi:DNA-binding transcriptional ArsR family regulator/uncharacterized protein YndB with AHSA1/START domain
MDEVFRALNDGSRRLLLDRLYERDGQTLGELCEHLPGMTRYGVMNHLRVLEEGGLVTTRRESRSKYHYLNPIPIRLVHDRWISKYTEPVIGAIADLKARVERGGRTMTHPTHVYQTYIRSTLDNVWAAITDGDQTVQYYYGTRVESDWKVGSVVRYTYPDGGLAADGEVLAADPPRRLEMTFHPRWDPDLEAEGAAHMVWLLEEENGMVKLVVEYLDLDPASKTYAEFAPGISYIVAGLKTLLETGKPMATRES